MEVNDKSEYQNFAVDEFPDRLVREYSVTADEEKLIATALYFYQESGTIHDNTELELLYQALGLFDEYVDAGRGYSWESQ